LEAALVSVWQAAPDELHELVQRLKKNPTPNLVKIFFGPRNK
jgi:hypothetical protein